MVKIFSVFLVMLLTSCVGVNKPTWLGLFRHVGEGRFLVQADMPFFSMLFNNGGAVNIDVGGFSYFYAEINRSGKVVNYQPFEGAVHLDGGSPLLGYQSDSHIIRRSYYKKGQSQHFQLPDDGKLAAWFGADMPPAILLIYSEIRSQSLGLNAGVLIGEVDWEQGGDNRQALLAVEPSIYELVPGRDYQQFLQEMAKQESACAPSSQHADRAASDCLVSRQLPVIYAIKARQVIHLDKSVLKDQEGIKTLSSRLAMQNKFSILAGGQLVDAVFTRYEAAQEETLPLIWHCDGPDSCYPSGTDKDNGETLVYAVLAGSASELLGFLQSKIPFSLSGSKSKSPSPLLPNMLQRTAPSHLQDNG